MIDLGELVIDRPEEGCFIVDRGIYVDEALHEIEVRRVFEGTWVYLAHTSQIPSPGDFITTVIGRQPVIVSRNREAKVRAFINACAHRGAAVCRVPAGRNNAFVCPFHGWTYDLDGRNIAVGAKSAGGYLPSFDDRPHDLAPIPRVEIYRGFVFGSLNADVPPLEEHLGAARAFIDLVVDPAPEGLEVVRGAASYSFDGNWKLCVENGIDGYHFTSVHATYARIARRRTQPGASAGARGGQIDPDGTIAGKSGGYDLGRGHGVVWSVIPNPEVIPLYAQREDLVARHGAARADWMIGRLRNLVVYPNLLLMAELGLQIRVPRPIGVGRTEVTTHCLAPIGEPPEARAWRVMHYADFFGASGVGTPDDLAEFNACQVGYSGRRARRHSLDRGAARTCAGPDEEARALGITPVASTGHIGDEAVLFGQYREWLRLMREEGDHAR